MRKRKVSYPSPTIMSIFLNVKDYFECSLSKSYSSSSNTLGIDLWRGRRCCSGNLQLPPLSQRQSGRARTPEGDGISRPTTLPLMTLPSIAITTVTQECWHQCSSTSCYNIEMLPDVGKYMLS
ncbi:hypothetical protein FD754_008881 [Muntiacus muntjak]|uniref:cAMP-specific 3',5'-cyclic phosphodiesterase 4B n=1 Tax=Muntiacus muntjak TaxID=9888 RepID=A0A5N3WVC8_MUNMU|nr:hypothetical protein FD754_008881 [Muntiacus muntjak]